MFHQRHRLRMSVGERMPVGEELLVTSQSSPPSRSLPCFANDTVFAMRAPAGTTIQLAEPQGGQFT